MKAWDQFKPILKKDLKLILNIKTLTIIVIVPFIMMFLIVGLPVFFMGATSTTIAIYNADMGSTSLGVNLGDLAVQAIDQKFENNSNVEIEMVESRAEALNESNGIYIPANFTEATFAGQSKLEFRSSSGTATLQAAVMDQALNTIQETVFQVFIALNLEEDLPSFQTIEYEPPIGEPSEGWRSETIEMASPFAYAIFILITLVGAMGRSIGFGKEKSDGTFETMLTITKNRSILVLSKLIIGIIASLLSTLAYFAGSALAAQIAMGVLDGTGSEGIGLEGILSFPMDELFSYKGIVLLVGLGISLIITMLALMTIDTLFSQTVSERLGTSLVMGFGILFYFAVAFDPTTTAIYAQVTPFYWIYHVFLSIIDLSFGWVDIVYSVLIVALLIGMIILATKAIEREKVLFTS
ncbi:MAG: ABC transporter permease [Asgard group archaeon]|nr:ABC transporter permease [Asgard group archaeon]